MCVLYFLFYLTRFHGHKNEARCIFNLIKNEKIYIGPNVKALLLCKFGFGVLGGGVD